MSFSRKKFNMYLIAALWVTFWVTYSVALLLLG